MESTLNDPQRRVTLGILVGAWLIMAAPMAAAQEVDSRWAPWLGCWRAVDEMATAPVLCVVPLERRNHGHHARRTSVRTGTTVQLRSNVDPVGVAGEFSSFPALALVSAYRVFLPISEDRLS